MLINILIILGSFYLVCIILLMIMMIYDRIRYGSFYILVDDNMNPVKKDHSNENQA
jgi:hypothetical protein